MVIEILENNDYNAIKNSLQVLKEDLKLLREIYASKFINKEEIKKSSELCFYL